MLRRDPKFRRVKVGGYGFLQSTSYWLGPDHLLVVVVAGYVESYRRFLFSDIQALVVQKDRDQLIWGVIASGLGLLCLVAALLSAGGQTPGAAVSIFLLLGLLAGMLVVGNWLRGPTCICHIRTAVQTVPLPQITRWRKAQKLIAELEALIEFAPAPQTFEPGPGPAAAGSPISP
jgi:hypothetical protein